MWYPLSVGHNERDNDGVHCKFVKRKNVRWTEEMVSVTHEFSLG